MTKTCSTAGSALQIQACHKIAGTDPASGKMFAIANDAVGCCGPGFLRDEVLRIFCA